MSDCEFGNIPTTIVLDDGEHFADISITDEYDKKIVYVYMHTGAPQSNHLVFTMQYKKSDEIKFQELYKFIQDAVPKYDVMMEMIRTISAKQYENTKEHAPRATENLCDK